jgi:hypothetical protein
LNSLYIHGDRPVKPLSPIRITRPQGGTAHRNGWTQQVRLYRVLLAAAHAQCPRGVRGDRESVAGEVIDFIHELDPKAIHLLRLTFAMLWKLSGNGSHSRRR